MSPHTLGVSLGRWSSYDEITDAGSQSEPVILKDGLFAVPLLLTLRLIAPAAVSGITLYVLARLYDAPFNRSYIVLTALVVILSFVLLRPPRNLVMQLLAPRLSLITSLGVRWAIMMALLLAVGFLTQSSEEYSRLVLASWAVVTPVLLACEMLIMHKVVRQLMGSPAHARNVVLVGCNEMSCALAARLHQHPELCMSVSGFFDDRSFARFKSYPVPFTAGGDQKGLLGKLADITEYIRNHPVDAIFIALPLREVARVQQLLKELQDTTASIYYLPDLPLGTLAASLQVRPCELLGLPVVALCEGPFHGCRGAIKRSMDIVLASTLLLMLAPLLVALVIAVRLSSRGPVIFRQRRYGLNGDQIVVYKFRTMTVIEDGEQIPQATRDDLRTTKVGRFLRRYSLDELPQLVNVLQGRMSLVGPRPHAVAHNEEYRKLIRGYMVRHKILPGMTGLAQVNGYRGQIERLEEMEARVQLDLQYLRSWSPMLDLKILLLTIPRAISSDKAY